MGRWSPKRLAVQAYVDGRHLLREQALPGPMAVPGTDPARRAPRGPRRQRLLPSPFDEAAVLTLDRGGDFLSTTLQRGTGHRLRTRLAEVRNPDSLGEVYSALTWYLGFHPNADEGKTMGLAPYGRDKLVPELAELVQRMPDGLFRVNLAWFAYQREGRLAVAAVLEPLRAAAGARVGHQRDHEDLAFAVQDLMEEPASTSPGRCSGAPGPPACASPAASP